MYVQVQQGYWLKVVSRDMTEYLPAHVLREPQPVGKVWREADEDFVDLIDGLRDYVVAFPDLIASVEVVEGFGSRLIGGPSGFTTDWGVWPTLAEAEADYEEFFK